MHEYCRTLGCPAPVFHVEYDIENMQVVPDPSSFTVVVDRLTTKYGLIVCPFMKKTLSLPKSLCNIIHVS